jgi:alpha-amylase/alpha-mannosidase (GH57 family)
MTTHYVAIHGHFYQPPREDPFTGVMPREAGAEPFHDFNEKITRECYQPNAFAGNFDRLSFNIGPTLIGWLSRYQGDTYARILQADQAYARLHGTGNAIAQPVHHTILPLARRRDNITQISWGIASFRHRFQRQPRGMWLPELAIDLVTLECLSEQGLSFTILSEEQVRGDLRSGAGPYRVRLPGGGYFAVFVRDRLLSNQLSFDMEQIGNGRSWLEWNLRTRPGLTLIATDGETFGHHHRSGIRVLSDMLHANGDTPYTVIALTDYLCTHPPITEIEVNERTSWSCTHGLARWDTGCGCTPGDHSWKPRLRSALDLLADEIDAIYQHETRHLLTEPWRLVYQYIDVVLGKTQAATLIDELSTRKLTSQQLFRTTQLALAQLHRQRMFSSCGWFFEQIDRPEPRYVIAQAMRAIQLVNQATGVDLGPHFRDSLCVARCEQVPSLPGKRKIQTAADLYDELTARLLTAD